MLINIEVNNNVEIRFLDDLFLFGQLQEVGSIKVNISKIARELECDRKTVKNYLNGHIPKKTRKRLTILIRIENLFFFIYTTLIDILIILITFIIL